MSRLYLLSGFSLGMLMQADCRVRVIRLVSSGIKEYKATLEKIMQPDAVVSAVGHESTAGLMSELLGENVPVNREQIMMDKGDKALVFQIMGRLPEGRVLAAHELLMVPYKWCRVDVL